MLKLLLFLSVLQAIECACPSGFEVVNCDECRGKYARVDSTWKEAQYAAVDKCHEILGQPIIIHNEQDQKYWTGRVAANVWTVIGLVCNSSSKRWEWVDGSTVDYKPTSYSSALNADCIPSSTWVMRAPDGEWSYSYSNNALSTDIFCSTPLRQPIPNGDGCEGFEDDSDDGVCYQVGTAAKSWQDAQQICSELGANLASIHTSQENNFVRRLAVSKGAVDGIFLGATMSRKTQKFKWIDGSDWDYDNMYPGFPFDGVGDCLAMDTSPSSPPAPPSGLWMNKNCSAALPVACVRQQNASPKCNAGPWKDGKNITSPGFPYSASTPCDFFLTVEEGKTVEAEIFLEANPCCDFLILHDDFVGGNIIANLTGELHNVTYTSPSNLMRVSWQPKGGENVRGLMMTYRGV